MQRTPTGGASGPDPAPVWRPDWPGLACGAILAIGLLAIYSRVFSVPFLFDDMASIKDNLSIRRLWPIWPALSPPHEAGVGGRPLLNLSYALNYALGGSAVAGYHALNLLVHVLAAWTLFALVRRTLRRPVLAERFGAAAAPLALAVGAIWAWHPVQTVSVTYLSQRAESLMGLFYLLTLYCFVRGAETEAKGGRRLWFTCSVLACLAGVGTKEVIATAPLLALLYDRTFISGSFSVAWRRHRLQHMALAATWLLLGFIFVDVQHGGVGFGKGVVWWAYGLTECRVVVKYLLLALWPSPLIFDYGMYVPVRLSEVWPYVLVLASLVAVTVVALRRAPVAGFAACWFLLILAPTSSIIPIFGQPMAENRLYLPVAGVVALTVIGFFALVGRRSLPVLAIVAAGLGLGSFQRNRDYSSELSIWTDTIAKNPNNPRAHNDLGYLLESALNRVPEAIVQYKEAVRLKPDYSEAHSNLGDALLKMPGKLSETVLQSEAVFELEMAVTLKPDNVEAHNNLGNALLKMPGRLNEAVAEYQEALRLKPDYPDAHNNLGNAFLQMPGRLDDAIAQYKEALRLKTDYAEAHNNLGNCWLKTPGRVKDALAEYEEAARLKPDYAEPHNNAGFILENALHRGPEALAQFEEAVRLKPDFAEAHNNLGDALSKMPGRLNDAILQFEEVVRLKPDFADAHYNLGNVLSHVPGRLNDAIAQYQEAVRLKPDLTAAHNNLGNVLSHVPGRLNDAIAQYREVVRLKPDYAEAHYNLGNALAHTPGGWNDAIAQYEEAVRLKPDHAPAHFNLAMALLQIPGRRGEAKAHLETFVRLRPDNERARQILAELEAVQF